MGTRILTVEDDERIRTAVKLALEAEGWQVEEAAAGEEALEHFEQHGHADIARMDADRADELQHFHQFFSRRAECERAFQMMRDAGLRVSTVKRALTSPRSLGRLGDHLFKRGAALELREPPEGARGLDRLVLDTCSAQLLAVGYKS